MTRRTTMDTLFELERENAELQAALMDMQHEAELQAAMVADLEGQLLKERKAARLVMLLVGGVCVAMILASCGEGYKHGFLGDIDCEKNVEVRNESEHAVNEEMVCLHAHRVIPWLSDAPIVVTFYDKDDVEWGKHHGGMYDVNQDPPVLEIINRSRCLCHTALSHELLHHRHYVFFNYMDYDHEEAIWLMEVPLEKELCAWEGCRP